VYRAESFFATLDNDICLDKIMASLAVIEEIQADLSAL